jgi:hypothetical protein
MSGLSASPPPTAPPLALGPHADALLTLAAFVQNPEYAARVKELRDAERAATEQQEAALREASRARSLLADHSLRAAYFDRASAETSKAHTHAAKELAARETAVAEREAAVNGREAAHAQKSRAVKAELDDRAAQLDAREVRLGQQSKELAASLAAHERDRAALDRRIAKLREAAQ